MWKNSNIKNSEKINEKLLENTKSIETLLLPSIQSSKELE